MALIDEASAVTRRMGRAVPAGSRLVVWGLLLFLAWQVAMPIAGVFVASLKDLRPLDDGFLTSPLVLGNFGEIIASGGLWRVTSTTFVFAFLSSTIALVVGSLLAFVTVRSDLPFGWLVATLVLLQLTIPELLVAISWTFLLGPDLGLFNQGWAALTGAEAPLFDVYSLGGMVLVESMILVPLIYLFAVPAFSALDGSLEDAAAMSGAGHWRSMKSISVPLIAPALVATWIIAFMRAWEAFEVPWVLGLRERIMTYATRIYWDTVTPPSDTGIISAYAVPMILLAGLMVWAHRRVSSRSARYAVISGKPAPLRRLRLTGVARVAVAAVTLLVVTFGILLPFLMLVWLSLVPFYRPPSLEALSAVSLGSWERVFVAEGLGKAVMSSFVIGLGASAALVALSVLVGWVSIVSGARGSGIARTLCFLPVALPNIVVGLAFLWIYMLIGVQTSQSYVVLVLAYVTLFLPVVSQNVLTQFGQINGELFEAPRLCGAREIRIMVQIALPLLAPAVFASVLYILIWSFKELPASLLLSGSSTRPMAVFMFDLSRNGSVSVLAAIALITVLILSVLIVLFRLLARRIGLRGF
ncbi:ABC transporter permease [Histidinibacterium lentulum]|uniref:Iron ABC transporter permease n=1 Tax=Histidinibacterium lentulum TaxID=2480588 RepID=A0A3N2R7G0_9RHOB|nr:ABC transporter permease subunit [Histidinibacterium lentulum]ROU03425.1 iron ABC transporter permease [Histidinibacterium lentulum]